ncbi:24830_t:CDS:1 [Dentiscutata erythropus]|uniref:24830_t:CDS:1 n=1 Tax=Dentiscutata erythropus TaxID=1348616 RepID=A0A9N9JGM2_9GLOM|nr:24830_t:CDS:1 [Dentiscutata erythropus]
MSTTARALISHNASVELRITLKIVPKLDLPSQSNPQIFLLLQDSQGSRLINHSHNKLGHIENEPNFSFILEYRFEELQNIKIVVANGDKSLNLESQGSAPNEQGLIGEFVTDIGSILGKSKRNLEGDLVLTERSRGQISISGRELPPKNGKSLNLKVQGLNLQLPSLAKPDVFYKLSRRIKGNSDINSDVRVLHESERYYSRNPDWSVIKLSEGDLLNGGSNDEVCFTCWQHKRDGNHKSIGECVLKIDKLLSSNKVNKVSLTPKGELLLQCASEKTFLGYIAGGLEIRLSIAIDFTSSNRHYIYGVDLHDISSDETNYGRIIRFIGSVLESYSTDGQIPVYGFGGKFYGSGEVSHNFPLNQKNHQPEVFGISGVLEIYKKALENVILLRPSKFAPTIQSAINRLKSLADDPKVYEVLLIITYGMIDDMESTIETIMQASVLPLSIIIIGVGTADCKELADFKSYNWGNLNPRDIVQFVAMKDFENQNQINIDLPKAVLKKIPSQVMNYMLRKELP